MFRHRGATKQLGAIIATVALLGAACGGDDDDSGGETTAATAEQSATADSGAPSTDGGSTTTSGKDTSTGSTSTEQSTAGSETSSTAETAPEEEAQVGGDLVLYSNSAPQNLAPGKGALAGSGGATTFIAVYDALVVVDYATGKVSPRIAESLEPNDDFTEWTMRIRPGVTFTDGTAYDAAAVVANWEKRRDPAYASQCITVVNNMEFVATDELTVTVTLPNPQVDFPYQLQPGCLSTIGSPTASEQFGDSIGTTPETIVGAGPFKVTRYTAGTEMVAERNPDYWDAPRPYVDTLTISVAGGDQAGADGLLTGAAQAIEVSSFGPHTTQMQDAGMVDYISDTPGGLGLVFNTTRAPMDDVRVREALVRVLDRQDIINKAGAGAAAPVEMYFPESSPYFDSGQPLPLPVAPGVEAAQALIDEYAAEKGGPVVIDLPAPEAFAPFWTSVAQNWEKLENVDVNLQILPNSEILTRLQTYDYTAQIGLPSYNDSYGLFNAFQSEQRAPIGLGLSDPEIDGWIAEAQATDDPTTRGQMFRNIMDKVLNTNYWQTVVQPYSNGQWYDPEALGGVQRWSLNYMDLAHVWLTNP